MNVMSAMKKPVDNRIAVIAFIFLICIALLSFTFYFIKLTYDINGQINKKAETAIELSGEVARLRSIQQKEKQMDLVVAQAINKIPAAPDEPGIIEFINNITEHGTLTGITFNKRINLNMAMEMPIVITATSSYSTLLEVLGQFSSSERYYSVSNISMNRTIGGELAYSINVSAYYKPNAA